MAVHVPQYNFIYFAIPQTGSKAIALTLRDRLEGKDLPPKGGVYKSTRIGKHHSTSRQLVKGGFFTKQEMAAIYKIGGVRNPWDLMVSRYYKHKERFATAAATVDEDQKYNWAARNPTTARSVQLAQEGTFPQWLDTLINELRGSSERGAPRVDHFDAVIRMEHLQDDFDKAMTHCGVPERVIVGEYNVTVERLAEGADTDAAKPADAAPAEPPKPRVKRDYTTLYDDASRQLIAEVYKDWIDRFGYEFGKPLPL